MKKEITTEEHLAKFHEQLNNILLFVAVSASISAFSLIMAIIAATQTA